MQVEISPQILVATFPQFISAKGGKEDLPGGGRVAVLMP